MKRFLTIALCLAMLFGVVGCGKVQFTLTLSLDGEGTVTPTSGSKYKSGTVVELIPTASSGWSFDKWSGPDAASVVTNADNFYHGQIQNITTARAGVSG